VEHDVCGNGVDDGLCEQCDGGGNTFGCDFDCTLAQCGDGYRNGVAGEQCDDGNTLDGDGCQSNCRSTRAILYDQLDKPTNGALTQDFESAYVTYDCDAADDFIITSPEVWDVQNVFARGSMTAEEILHVNVRFYPDSGGIPGGTAVCPFSGITDFEAQDGNLSIELPEACRLGPGHWWMSLQVRMNQSYGYYYWGTREERTFQGAVWKNPGDGLGTDCEDWKRVGQCLAFEDTDFVFRLLGPDEDDRDLPPARGGGMPLILTLGGGAAYVFARSSRTGVS
jgi:cysteine-rich repeat protein